MRSTVVASVLALVTFGCDDSRSVAASQPSAQKARAAPAASASASAGNVAAPASEVVPHVELISAGQSPRQTLRYRFVEGVETGTLSQKTQISSEAGGGPETRMPEMIFTLKMQTQKVDADGTAHLSYTYTDAKLGKTNLPVKMAEGMEKVLRELTNIEGRQSISAQGIVLESKVHRKVAEKPQTQQMLRSMSTSLQQALPPLPKEEVGTGATWKVVSTVQVMALRYSQTAHYKLVSKSGDEVELEVEIEQKAIASPDSKPSPVTAKAGVGKVSYSGKGQTVVHLRKLLPSSRIQVDTRSGSIASSVETRIAPAAK